MRLIDADALLDEVDRLNTWVVNDYGYCLEDRIVVERKQVECLIDEAPTVENYKDLEEQGLLIKWTPFKFREMDEDEKECYGELGLQMFDCSLPDDEEEILVTYANGFVGEDIFLRDGVECFLESGAEFGTQAIAWVSKPKPYKQAEQKLKEMGE